jgi:hypothetical protein
MADENFIAEAIGNLAAFELQRRRGEALVWQVIRVDGTSRHHYRIVIRHPERLLDLGVKDDLRRLLDDLSNETVDELRHRFERARQAGLVPSPLRHLHEEVDFWRDDFWNWLG